LSEDLVGGPCRRTLSEDLVGGDPEKRTAQPAPDRPGNDHKRRRSDQHRRTGGPGGRGSRAGDRWTRGYDHTGRHLTHHGRAHQPGLRRRQGCPRGFSGGRRDCRQLETQAARDAGSHRPNDIGALRALDPRGGLKSMPDNVIQRVEACKVLDVDRGQHHRQKRLLPQQEG
jgi:hypothetical protein